MVLGLRGVVGEVLRAGLGRLGLLARVQVLLGGLGLLLGCDELVVVGSLLARLDLCSPVANDLGEALSDKRHGDVGLLASLGREAQRTELPLLAALLGGAGLCASARSRLAADHPRVVDLDDDVPAHEVAAQKLLGLGCVGLRVRSGGARPAETRGADGSKVHAPLLGQARARAGPRGNGNDDSVAAHDLDDTALELGLAAEHGPGGRSAVSTTAAVVVPEPELGLLRLPLGRPELRAVGGGPARSDAGGELVEGPVVELGHALAQQLQGQVAGHRHRGVACAASGGGNDLDAAVERAGPGVSAREVNQDVAVQEPRLDPVPSLQADGRLSSGRRSGSSSGGTRASAGSGGGCSGGGRGCSAALRGPSHLGGTTGTIAAVRRVSHKSRARSAVTAGHLDALGGWGRGGRGCCGGGRCRLGDGGVVDLGRKDAQHVQGHRQGGGRRSEEDAEVAAVHDALNDGGLRAGLEDVSDGEGIGGGQGPRDAADGSLAKALDRLIEHPDAVVLGLLADSNKGVVLLQKGERTRRKRKQENRKIKMMRERKGSRGPQEQIKPVPSTSARKRAVNTIRPHVPLTSLLVGPLLGLTLAQPALATATFTLSAPREPSVSQRVANDLPILSIL